MSHEIADGEVFVFGSNLAGVHGAGAARSALEEFGAIWGQGIGRQGQSYAIPTKDGRIETLPLEDIAMYVNGFLRYASVRPDEVFFVTRIGCGLAGYKDADIAPLFRDAPANCRLDVRWREIIGQDEKSFPSI